MAHDDRTRSAARVDHPPGDAPERGRSAASAGPSHGHSQSLSVPRSSTSRARQTSGRSPSGQTSGRSPSGQAIVERPDPARLLKLAPGIVKQRHGAVLSRGTILRSDRYPSANTDRAHRFDGLNHFRQCALDIHGCSQPTAIGLRTALALLGARPLGSSAALVRVILVMKTSR